MAIVIRDSEKMLPFTIKSLIFKARQDVCGYQLPHEAKVNHKEGASNNLLKSYRHTSLVSQTAALQPLQQVCVLMMDFSISVEKRIMQS